MLPYDHGQQILLTDMLFQLLPQNYYPDTSLKWGKVFRRKMAPHNQLFRFHQLKP